MNSPGETQIFRAVLLEPDLDDRTHLRCLLRRHPSIRLMAEVENFRDACSALLVEGGDLLFLETACGEESLLDCCGLVPPQVRLIFVTGNLSAAVRAFELDAFDFLPKPLEASRLATTVRRLLRIDWQPSAPPLQMQTSAPVLLPFERGRRGVTLGSIVMIQAFSNYTRVLFDDGSTELVLRSLAKWEQILPQPPFLRVHRSALVHVAKVTRLEPSDDGHDLHLHGTAETVPVSRRALALVKKTLFADPNSVSHSSE